MDNDSFTEKDKYVNLSNITKLVSFSLFIAVIFTLIRYHFYYQVLLHIPIFQFVDTSELLLMAPTSAVTWIFYLGTFALTDFIKKNDDFTSFQKIIFPIIIYFVGISYIWINYLNDPIIRECIKLPWHYKYWFIWFPLLILCVVAYQFPNTKQPHFFKRNKFIIPLVLTIWYALFEGWANYEVVTTSKPKLREL